MGVIVKELNSNPVISVEGRLDSNNVSELDRVVGNIRPDTEKVTFDFSRLNYIS